MKKTVDFGIIRFYLTFIVLNVKDWDSTSYRVDRIVWTDRKGGELSISDMEERSDMLDHFEQYLKAILPALANNTTPEKKAPVDYNYRSYADKVAAMYDEGIDEVRDACNKCEGSGIEQASFLVGFEEACDECDGSGEDQYGSQDFNAFSVRSHTAYWNGDITLISTTF